MNLFCLYVHQVQAHYGVINLPTVYYYLYFDLFDFMKTFRQNNCNPQRLYCGELEDEFSTRNTEINAVFKITAYVSDNHFYRNFLRVKGPRPNLKHNSCFNPRRIKVMLIN